MKVLQLVLKRNKLFKGLTHVCFHLGYNQTMLFAIKEIIEDTGKEKEEVKKGNTCYIIKLGKG